MWAKPYLEHGWLPIPLVEKEKNPAGSGYTGSKNSLPATMAERVEAVKKWGAAAPKAANIGVWLDESLIGIDVDDYYDKKKEKKKDGFSQLEELEAKYGPLPKTWVSTARSDGRSGIRLFRIPSHHIGKLSYSGKAAEHIDVIQRKHRFCVVGPSYHPDEHVDYRWYSPEEWDSFADHSGQVSTTIPRTKALPELPEKWVEFLTRGYIKKTEKSIDMDSSFDEVKAWFDGWTNDPDGKPCKHVLKRYRTALNDIESRADSHEPLVAGHYSILLAALDGHRGVEKAAKAMEEKWYESVKERDKRGRNEANMEIFRSKAGALRMAKAQMQDLLDAGAYPVPSKCSCFNEELLRDTTGTGDEEIPSFLRTNAEKSPRDPSEYARTDDGNAEHFYDIFGENIKYIEGYKKFILWNGERWTRDGEEAQRTKLAYHVVRDRQEAYARTLENSQFAAEAAVETAKESGAEKGDLSGIASEAKAAKAEAIKWRRWADRSGFVRGGADALTALKSLNAKTVIPATSLDSDPTLLGMENGVIELTAGGYSFRKAAFDDFVTLSTGQTYIEGGLDDIKKTGGKDAEGLRMWNDYLRKFVPDPELRRFLQKVLGSCLGGPRKERIMVFFYGPTSTGKSTILESVLKAMGEYGAPVDLNIFKPKALNPGLATAMDRRIITTSEIGLDGEMDEGIVKRITGNDNFSVELKNSNEIKQGKMNSTAIIATNIAPSIRGADAALIRRLCVIPFNEQVQNDDTGFANEMAKLAPPAIMHWMLEGYQMYATEGLDAKNWPKMVKLSTEEFGEDMNDIGRFIKDNIVKVPFELSNGYERREATSIDVNDAHKYYMNWCNKQRIAEADVMNKLRFGRQMASMGFTSKPLVTEEGGKQHRRYTGCTFLAGVDKVVNIKTGSD